MGEKFANCDSSGYFSQSILSSRADQIYLSALFLSYSFGATAKTVSFQTEKKKDKWKKPPSRLLTSEWGGRRGAKLSDRKKAWPSINHFILSVQRCQIAPSTPLPFTTHFLKHSLKEKFGKIWSETEAKDLMRTKRKTTEKWTGVFLLKLWNRKQNKFRFRFFSLRTEIFLARPSLHMFPGQQVANVTISSKIGQCTDRPA